MTLDLQALARLGAAARLAELESEMSAIRAAFPDLDTTKSAKPATGAQATAKKKRPYRMSAAQRRAVSARMKALWATRRTAKPEAVEAPAAPDKSEAADRARAARRRRAGRRRRK